MLRKNFIMPTWLLLTWAGLNLLLWGGVVAAIGWAVWRLGRFVLGAILMMVVLGGCATIDELGYTRLPPSFEIPVMVGRVVTVQP